MLKRALEGVLSEAECGQLYSAFDQVGGIIIVRIPEPLMPKRGMIGRALLDEIRPARSVYCQSSDVQGDFRTRDLELLAGEDDTTTEYRESGCRFLVDVKSAFFSPRLSTERERIAGLINDGEAIVNMFAGVGTFSIMAARKKKCRVYSIDINPAASALCGKNISMNRLAGSVICMNGDAARIIRDRLPDAGDRTLMLLPERSDEFLQSAIDATRDGGIIHYYSHIHSDSKKGAPGLSEAHYLDITPAKSEILCSKIVRAVGPRYYQTVVDARIAK